MLNDDSRINYIPQSNQRKILLLAVVLTQVDSMLESIVQISAADELTQEYRTYYLFLENL